MGHGASLGHGRYVAVATMVSIVWAVERAAHVLRVHACAFNGGFRPVRPIIGGEGLSAVSVPKPIVYIISTVPLAFLSRAANVGECEASSLA